MTVETELKAEIREVTKKQRTSWHVRACLRDTVVFDSDWISVRCRDRQGAECLSELVSDALRVGLYAPPPGHLQNWNGLTHERGVTWREIEADDWGGQLFVDGVEVGMRVEHLGGPMTGGIWWWWAKLADTQISQTETGVDGKKLGAAKWLAELGAGALVHRYELGQID